MHMKKHCTLNISLLAWCSLSSGWGVLLGLVASLSDKTITSGDRERLSQVVSLAMRRQTHNNTQPI